MDFSTATTCFEPFSIGAFPLVVDAGGPHLFGGDVCGMAVTRHEIGPGRSLVAQRPWDGSFEFVDHESLLGGKSATRKPIYVEPGRVPVALGLERWTTSWPADRRFIEVLENDLNRGSQLGWDCRMTWGPGPELRIRVTNSSFGFSPVTARQGQSVRMFLNVTYDVTDAGCYLIQGFPALHLHNARGSAYVGPMERDDEGAYIYLSARQPSTYQISYEGHWEGFFSTRNGPVHSGPGYVEVKYSPGPFRDDDFDPAVEGPWLQWI